MDYRYLVLKEPAGPEIVGTKAWNLYAIKDRVRVPEFVVVSTEAYREYGKHGKIPPGLAREIEEVIKDVFHARPIAVRSSGTAEDLSGQSYAGMYATILNVTGIEGTIAAIQRVWDSNHSERVNAYRAEHGLKPGEMAVMVQRQLDPEVSGVMATRDPVQHDVSIIECCEGLGDTLVSGAMTPVRYRLRGRKLCEHSGEDLLSPARLLELSRVGQRIQKFFGVPQDIEWAFDHDRLYILQARPLTAVVQTVPKRITVWCNANVRETIPGPISSMMYSIFESIMFPMIIIDAFGVPITREQYRRYPAIERVLGRLYWNVNNTITLGRTIDPVMRLLSADRNLDPQMAIAFQYVDFRALPPLIPFFKSLRFSISAMMRMVFFVIKSSIFMRGTVRRVNRIFFETLALAASFEVSRDLKVGVASVRKLIEDIGSKISRRYFGGLFLSLFYLICLGKILSVRRGKRGGATARMTIAGLIDKTGEMVHAVDELSLYVRKEKGCADAEGVRRLWRNDRTFRRLFAEFIREFGHRGPAEFDVANRTWQEDYDMVFGLIATRSRSALTRHEHDSFDDIVKDSKPFERFFLKLLYPRICAFTPLRENGKHYYFKATARVKEQLLAIGEELAGRQYLNNSRDIFFLELKDLDMIVAGRATPEHVRDLIYQRKQERAKYETLDPPDIVFEDGSTLNIQAKQSPVFTGEPVSFGKTRGRARIIKDFKSSSSLEQGDILITHHTDPGWTPLFSIAGGVVIEVGGLICHAAMVARELGLPAVVLPGATSSIPDGARIELDADMGTVRIMEKKA